MKPPPSPWLGLGAFAVARIERGLFPTLVLARCGHGSRGNTIVDVSGDDLPTFLATLRKALASDATEAGAFLEVSKRLGMMIHVARKPENWRLDVVAVVERQKRRPGEPANTLRTLGLYGLQKLQELAAWLSEHLEARQ